MNNEQPVAIEYYEKNYVSLSAWAEMAIEYWTNEALKYFKEKIFTLIEILSSKIRNILTDEERNEYRKQIAKYDELLEKINHTINNILLI